MWHTQKIISVEANQGKGRNFFWKHVGVWEIFIYLEGLILLEEMRKLSRKFSDFQPLMIPISSVFSYY